MQQLTTERHIPHSSYVEGLIEEVYSDLCIEIDRFGVTAEGYPIPNIHEMCERIWKDVYTEIQLDLIQESIDRGDHEIYGYSKDEYRELAIMDQINEPSLTPIVEYADLVLSVHDYLISHHYFFLDYMLVKRNIPIMEVW